MGGCPTLSPIGIRSETGAKSTRSKFGLLCSAGILAISPLLGADVNTRFLGSGKPQFMRLVGVPLWQVQPLVHLGPKAVGWWQGPSNGLPSAERSEAPSRSSSATTPSSLWALPPMAYFLCLRWLSFRSRMK